MVGVSSFWLCQSASGLWGVGSIGTTFSFVELAAKERLDAVHLDGDVAGREARDRFYWPLSTRLGSTPEARRAGT